MPSLFSILFSEQFFFPLPAFEQVRNFAARCQFVPNAVGVNVKHLSCRTVGEDDITRAQRLPDGCGNRILSLSVHKSAWNPGFARQTFCSGKRRFRSDIIEVGIDNFKWL